MGKLFFKGLNTSNTGDWQVTLEVIFLAKPFKNENDKHSFGFLIKIPEMLKSFKYIPKYLEKKLRLIKSKPYNFDKYFVNEIPT